MITIEPHDSHKFNKVNMVTQKDGSDTYRCACGVKGKRYNLHGFSLKMTDADAKKAAKRCALAPAPAEKNHPTKVKITNFTGVSSQFANLTNGSEHDVVPCPKADEAKYKDDIWVMGVSEPVRLLPHEYQVVK